MKEENTEPNKAMFSFEDMNKVRLWCSQLYKPELKTLDELCEYLIENTHIESINIIGTNDEGWIFVEKDLPKNKQSVLTVDSYGGIMVAYYNHKEEQWFTSEGSEWEEVEYWRKLPEIPKELRENDEELID